MDQGPGYAMGPGSPGGHSLCQVGQGPDILILHMGGNDLGLRSSRELIRYVKFDFLRHRTAFPDMLILWSDVVAHSSWRMARLV